MNLDDRPMWSPEMRKAYEEGKQWVKDLREDKHFGTPEEEQAVAEGRARVVDGYVMYDYARQLLHDKKSIAHKINVQDPLDALIDSTRYGEVL